MYNGYFPCVRVCEADHLPIVTTEKNGILTMLRALNVLTYYTLTVNVLYVQ